MATVQSAAHADAPPTSTVRAPVRHRRPERGAAARSVLERYSGVTTLLVLTDVAALAGAVLVTRPALGWAAASAVTLVTVRVGARLYRRRLTLDFLADLPRAVSSIALALGILNAAMLALATDQATIITVDQAVFWFAGLSTMPRPLVFACGRWARKRFGRCERTLVVGAGHEAAELSRTMREHPEFGLNPVGLVDASPAGRADKDTLPAHLVRKQLAFAVRRHRASAVVLALGDTSDRDVTDLVIAASQLGASIFLLPRMHELYRDSSDIERVRSFPLVRLASAPTHRPSWWVKTVVDRVVAMTALLFLAPLMLAVTLSVLIESGRPVLFVQDRISRDGRVFRLLKFRSLRPANPEDAELRWSVAGDPGIGPVGRFLRRTAIDELPQLWNIVRGDMSIVGPRPERPGFVEQFSAVHDRYWARHRVPAGLTGLAQVNGLRGDTSIADRSRYDNYYIANWSLWLDVKIVLMTTRELFRRGQH